MSSVSLRSAVHRLAPFLIAFGCIHVTNADDSDDERATYPILVTDSECDCFQTLGQEENYFQHHQFWDFRSLNSYYKGIPRVKTTLIGARDAPETSPFFTSSEWTSTWALQNWNNSGNNPFGGADYMMMNSLSNVYVDLNGDSEGDDISDTYLVLRTAKLDDFQSAAEFQSQDENYHYLSMRMYARVAGDPGACAAMFTYREDDNIYRVQEADIEILTSGPDDKLQYTNQPSYTTDGRTIDDSTRNVTMPGAATWRDWALYRFDWSPSTSSWYVNGEPSSSIKFQTPKDPASLIFNTWGDGGAWTGNMEEGGRAYLQIQWFEMVYNTTGQGEDTRKRDFGGEANKSRSKSWALRLTKRNEDEACAKVCSIDATNITGQPVMLYDGFAPVLRPRAALSATILVALTLLLW